MDGIEGGSSIGGNHNQEGEKGITGKMGSEDTKQIILDHFGSDFRLFYSRWISSFKQVGIESEYIARCPFPLHDDKTPSFNFNSSNGMYVCHGCGEKGDIFSFYSKMTGMNSTFPAVLKAMAEYFGIYEAKKEPPDFAKRFKKASERKPENEHLQYLEKRGIVDGLSYLQKHKLIGFESNRILFPMTSKGRIEGLQQVPLDGSKKTFVAGSSGKNGLLRFPGEGPTIVTEAVIDAISAKLSTDYGAVATFSASTVDKLRGLSGDFVLFFDNDDAGRKATEKAAAILPGARAVDWGLSPNGAKDINDLLREGHQETIARMVEESKPLKEEQSDNKFTRAIITGKDLEPSFLKTLSQPWRIKGILPCSASLSEIFGLPGTYKSFLALDMALCIAAGIDWHGRRTKQCATAYVAAEGQSGVLKRIKAWMKYHKVKSLELFSLIPRSCLLDEPGELDELIDALKSLPVIPGVVFIDTLARCMAGDENSTSDMGKMVIACGKITETTGAQDVLVHHTGKDTNRGPRGAIALTGATDCLFEVKKEGDRLATLRCERQKDDEPFPDMAFRLEVQTTGYVNDEGEDVVSLVPVHDPDAVREFRSNQPKISGAKRVALDALKRLYDDNPVHVDDWRAAAYSAGISASTDQEAKRKAFTRAVAALLDGQFTGCKDDCYWPCG